MPRHAGRSSRTTLRRSQGRWAARTTGPASEAIRSFAMSLSQADKALRLRELHAGPRAFVIANAFDAGSATLLTQLGFAALATSSGAAAGVLGRKDGQLSRDEALAHAQAIAAATELPVSADLEDGFGDSPDDVAETIRRAGATGIVGALDRGLTAARRRAPLYPIDLAAARIAAAVRAARSLPFAGFAITARAENYLPRLPGPRRHDRAPEGVRSGRRRRAVRTGAARSRGRSRGVRSGDASRSTSWSA